MPVVRGTYFDGRSAGGARVQVQLVRGALIVRSADAAQELISAPAAECRLSSAIGKTSRVLSLPDGASVECESDQDFSELEHGLSSSDRQSWLHTLERARGTALAALLIVVAAGWGLYAWGIPWAAKRVAFALPEPAAVELSEQSFAVLERVFGFDESTLDEAEKAALRAEFAQLAARGGERLQLHFRSAGEQANAFALPAGDIIVTDELVRLAEDPREVVAVLAHEVAHVRERHTLRIALENSGLFFVLGAILGDVGSVSSLAAAVPTVLAEAQYSQKHESEADRFAADYCLERGWDPRLLGALLSRIAGAEELPAESLLSSHPSLAGRLQALEERARTAGFE